jgi:hypothetical protein
VIVVVDTAFAALAGFVVSQLAEKLLSHAARRHLEAGLAICVSKGWEVEQVELEVGGLVAAWQAYRTLRAWHETQLMKASAPQSCS